MKKYKNKTYFKILLTFIDQLTTQLIDQSSPLSTQMTTVKNGDEIGKPLIHLI